jgi:L-asparaginase II
MAAFSAADGREGCRADAMRRIVSAMATHPELVAGDGRACTDLMRAVGGRVALKTGAEAVYVGIIPDRKLGIALKIVDGATRASEAAITALLVRLGLLPRDHPMVAKYLTGPLRNWKGLATGELRIAPGFC